MPPPLSLPPFFTHTWQCTTNFLAEVFYQWYMETRQTALLRSERPVRRFQINSVYLHICELGLD